MNNKMLKVFITIIMVAMLVCVSTSVFADGPIDASQITGNNQVEDLSGSLNSGNNTNEEVDNNTQKEESGEIPHAGVESSALMVSAFVIFGIVGVYTYIKLSDYSNI